MKYVAYRNSYYEVGDEVFTDFQQLLGANPSNLEQIGARKLSARPTTVDYNVVCRGRRLALAARPRPIQRM